MGQADYADNFINLMLGWIRQVASSVAGMFQTNTGTAAGSGGQAMLDWFTNHWITLLIVLIVVGVIVDWVVWMLRWRPHWLWFGKRRVILDDDIDVRLSEQELGMRYGEEESDAPHFYSTALRREDEACDEYDEYGEEPYYDDEDDAYYGGDEDEAPPEDADYLEEAPPAEELPEEPFLPCDEEEDWADAPRKPREKKIRLRKGKKADQDEDPFDVNDKVFDDLDDDFFDVVSEEPTAAIDEDMRIYQRPTDDEPEEPPRTRKARRRMQEGQNH